MQKIVKILSIFLMTGTLLYGYSNTFVKKIQRELTELGYNPGPIDGRVGPHTRAAIKAFQKSIRRRPTGRITKGLQWQLHNMLNSAAAGFSQEAEEYNGIKKQE